MISEINENIDIIKEILKEKEFPLIDKVNVKLVKLHKIEDNSYEIFDKTISLESNIDAETMTKVSELIEELQPKIKGDFDINLDNLKQNLNDSPLHIIPKVQQVLNGGKEVDILPKIGEVTLLDFWATWCPPCQGPMLHNQRMLEKHTDWKGKVRIVGASFDKQIETVKERVILKKWTLVDHYFIPGGFESEVSKYFNIQGIPFCVLVGKDGKIKLTGHPMSMNLEENIQKLIDNQPISHEKYTSSKIVEIAQLPNEEQVKEFIKSIMGKIDKFMGNLKKLKIKFIYNFFF